MSDKNEGDGSKDIVNSGAASSRKSKSKASKRNAEGQDGLLGKELNKTANKRGWWENICESILIKFDLIQKMGRGNYGTVWKAIDKRDRSRVAIKKINDAFNNMVDAQRTLREIYILKELHHPNIMKLYNLKIGKNHKDVYMFIELGDVDLLTLIRAGICSDP